MYLIEIFLSVQNLVNILSPKVGFDWIFFGRISLFSLDFQANKGQLEFFFEITGNYLYRTLKSLFCWQWERRSLLTPIRKVFDPTQRKNLPNPNSEK